MESTIDDVPVGSYSFFVLTLKESFLSVPSGISIFNPVAAEEGAPDFSSLCVETLINLRRRDSTNTRCSKISSMVHCPSVTL